MEVLEKIKAGFKIAVGAVQKTFSNLVNATDEEPMVIGITILCTVLVYQVLGVTLSLLVFGLLFWFTIHK